jgi:hypothetical protein
MTETPCPTVLKYQRSSYTSNAIVFDADLNLHSLEQLRELARDGVQFSIVDVETEEGVTKVLLAQGHPPSGVANSTRRPHHPPYR